MLEIKFLCTGDILDIVDLSDMELLAILTFKMQMHAGYVKQCKFVLLLFQMLTAYDTSANFHSLN